MKRSLIVIFTFCALGLGDMQAQTKYAIFEGPSHFMRLNDAGDDFVSVDNNEAKGNYTFYHSYLDIQNPWSVVSEEGTNIYTKLNLKDATDFKEVFMVSPELQLSTTGIYTFSQALFGMLNKADETGAIAKVELQLLEGKPEDFTPEILSGMASLGFSTLRENTVTDFVVENLVPENSGSHYFVLYVTYVGYYPGNTEGMSIGFKKNQVINTFGTSVKKLYNIAFNVYPNPASDEITIEGLNGKLKVFNLIGACVMSFDDYNSEKLDVSNLESGTYILQSDQAVIRFVKK